MLDSLRLTHMQCLNLTPTTIMTLLSFDFQQDVISMQELLGSYRRLPGVQNDEPSMV